MALSRERALTLKAFRGNGVSPLNYGGWVADMRERQLPIEWSAKRVIKQDVPAELSSRWNTKG
jgi:hypothetical protein